MSPIKLGKPSMPPGGVPPGPPGSTPGTGEADEPRTGDLRGYEIDPGSRPKVKAKKEKAEEAKGISPVILFAAAAALVVLLLVIVAGPSKPGADSTADEAKELIASYTTYLKQQKVPAAEIDARVREVQSRLEAISWAERVGRKDVVRHELDLLLVYDTDRTSPVYRFASRRLSRL